MSDHKIPRLLAIDDEPQALRFIEDVLSNAQVEIHTAGDSGLGLEMVKRLRPQIVLLDLVMPGICGFEMLERILQTEPETEVIVMTAHHSTESASEAIQKGASDYIEKPFNVERLRRGISESLFQGRERQKLQELEPEPLNSCQLEGTIGSSPLMLKVFAKVRRIAPHFRTVLLTGPTGTGKELVARALHRLSPASSGPFAVSNCSAMVETLAESELFGYVRGSFTGAVQDKIGVFEHGNHGVVFLDEIGELPLSSQAKLLRVLQTHEIQPIGSPVPRPIDVRVIAATNRNFRSLVKEGRFREDLYYRLAMVEISMPRLVDRRDDLPLLERHFLEKFSKQYNKPVPAITRRAQTRMAIYSWPGNVRELENVIGNACMMVDGTVIDVKDLPEQIRGPSPDIAAQDEVLMSLRDLQKRHVLRVLKHVGGNKSQAAEILRVSRATIYRLLADSEVGNPI